MRVIECAQLSDAWWETRRGVPTASNFSRILTAVGKQCVMPLGHDGGHVAREEDAVTEYGQIMAKRKRLTKSLRCPVTVPQLSSQADDYIAELIADVACQSPSYFSQQGRPVNNYGLQHGIDQEPHARKWYSIAHEPDVVEVGFVLDDEGRFGCSPDGLVGEHGGLELKCPLPKTHAGYLMKPESLLTEYRAQVHGALIVTGRSWWDLVSYCDHLPPLRLRVEPGDYTESLRAALGQFWEKYMAALERVRGMR